MANDPLVDIRVIRALDSSGNVHNLLCDANGNLIVTSGGSAAPDQVQLVDGTTPTQKAAVSAAGVVKTELPTAAALSDTTANPTGPMVGAGAMFWDGAQWVRARATTGGFAGASLGNVGVPIAGMVVSDGANARMVGNAVQGDGANQQLASVIGYLYNGVNCDRPRTSNVFKTAAVTGAGDNALWTPTSGKKFRLMGLIVELTDNAATAGGAIVTVALRDATTAIGVTFSAFCPAAALTGGAPVLDTGWISLGNGSLSAAANNVLNINLSAALSAGTCRVTCCGTEE